MNSPRPRDLPNPSEIIAPVRALMSDKRPRTLNDVVLKLALPETHAQYALSFLVSSNFLRSATVGNAGTVWERA